MTGADPLAELAALEGVGSAMAAARDGIDALLRDRGMRRTAATDTAESLLRGAHASAVLDGSDRDLEQLRVGDVDPPAAAALRASTELLALVPVLQRSPLQALARLHALAATDSEAETRGRPRDAEAARRLTALARLLTAGTAAPALVVAAVVHAEVALAAPFPTYNGVIARAVERMVIVGRGVDPVSVTVPEAGHLARRAEHEAGLRGYARGRAGQHAWLLHAASAYTAGAQASPLRS